ncbi:MAG: Xylulose kinase, partial [uncultured Thermomicrobiales bacterium]
ASPVLPADPRPRCRHHQHQGRRLRPGRAGGGQRRRPDNLPPPAPAVGLLSSGRAVGPVRPGAARRGRATRRPAADRRDRGRQRRRDRLSAGRPRRAVDRGDRLVRPADRSPGGVAGARSRPGRAVRVQRPRPPTDLRPLQTALAQAARAARLRPRRPLVARRRLRRLPPLRRSGDRCFLGLPLLNAGPARTHLARRHPGGGRHPAGPAGAAGRRRHAPRAGDGGGGAADRVARNRPGLGRGARPRLRRAGGRGGRAGQGAGLARHHRDAAAADPGADGGPGTQPPGLLPGRPRRAGPLLRLRRAVHLRRLHRVAARHRRPRRGLRDPDRGGRRDPARQPRRLLPAPPAVSQPARLRSPVARRLRRPQRRRRARRPNPGGLRGPLLRVPPRRRPTPGRAGDDPAGLRDRDRRPDPQCAPDADQGRRLRPNPNRRRGRRSDRPRRRRPRRHRRRGLSRRRRRPGDALLADPRRRAGPGIGPLLRPPLPGGLRRVLPGGAAVAPRAGRAARDGRRTTV